MYVYRRDSLNEPHVFVSQTQRWFLNIAVEDGNRLILFNRSQLFDGETISAHLLEPPTEYQRFSVACSFRIGIKNRVRRCILHTSRRL